MNLTPAARSAVLASIACVVDERLQPTPNLYDFARIFEWSHDGSFRTLVKAGQDSIPRNESGGLELKINDLLQNRAGNDAFTAARQRVGRRRLDRLFGQAGNEDSFAPRANRYRYLLLHGQSPFDAFRRTLATGTLLERGITVDEIVVFASTDDGKPDKSLAALWHAKILKPCLDKANLGINHELDPDDLPTSEMESYIWLLNNVLPAHLLDGIPITKIEVRKVLNKEGRLVTGSTGSSLVDWRDLGGPPGPWNPQRDVGNVLAVSNGWQYPRGAVITLHNLLTFDCGFENHIIDVLGAHLGYDHPFLVRYTEFCKFLYEVLHNVLPLLNDCP